MKRIYLPANWIPNISLENLNNLNSFNLENDEIISNAIHKVISLSEKFYLNGFAGLNISPFLPDWAYLLQLMFIEVLALR